MADPVHRPEPGDSGLDVYEAWDDICDAIDQHHADEDNPHAVDLTQLPDVAITAPAEGEVLVYDEETGTWVNRAATGLGLALDDLTDVAIDTPTAGQGLTYDGAQWVNGTPAIPSHGENHVDGSDDVPDLVGDSGAGGTHGLAPAPAAGDAAAGKYLKADGTWAVPLGTGGSMDSWIAAGDSGDAIDVGDGETLGLRGRGPLDVVGDGGDGELDLYLRLHEVTPGLEVVADDPGYGYGDSHPGLRVKEGVCRAAVTFVLDGDGSAIGTGVAGDLAVAFDGEIEEVYLLADQVGSIQVDVWRETFANYPPTDTDSLCAGVEPAISADDSAHITDLSGWTTALNDGDTLRFSVDSCSTITRCTIVLVVNRG